MKKYPHDYAKSQNFVIAYLIDLKHQYSDARCLAMFPEMLRELAQRRAPLAQPGPDYCIRL